MALDWESGYPESSSIPFINNTTSVYLVVLIQPDLQTELRGVSIQIDKPGIFSQQSIPN